jgi:hypothetical protein
MCGSVLIRVGYDIELQLPKPTTVIAMLNVHPARRGDLREPDVIDVSPDSKHDTYRDGFGNICTRIVAAQGWLRLINTTLIEDSGRVDAVDWNATGTPVSSLPPETMQFLLPSRYCEVDRLSDLAWEIFGNIPPG